MYEIDSHSLVKLLIRKLGWVGTIGLARDLGFGNESFLHQALAL